MKYILVNGIVDGRPSEHDGRLAVSFDVNRAVHPRMERGVIIDPSLVTTDDPAEALRFETVADAHAYWNRTSTVTPIRPDGKPNRPFTAYTISIMDPDADDTMEPLWKRPPADARVIDGERRRIN